MEADTPIHDAITKKNDTIIHMLLDSNADLSICNNNGFNPIHHAALRGNITAIHLIIEKLSEQGKLWLINERKEDGFTPLHLACLNNHFKVVKALIQLGNCNVNLRNLNQQAAIHLAIDRQHSEIIKLLLDSKCDVNVLNKDNENPLHCLVRTYNLFFIKKYVNQMIDRQQSFSEMVPEKVLAINLAYTLIQNGADLFGRNKNDQTPLDLCTDKSFNEMLMKKYKEIHR